MQWKQGSVFSMQEIKEEWRDIPNYEGLYQVSNLGRVKSLERRVRANTCGVRVVSEKILVACKGKSGYFLVVLCKNGKHQSLNVHRLVADVFIPNPFILLEVNHKDEDKANNRAENLEWCDRKYNANYGTGVQRQIISRALNPNDQKSRDIVGKMNSKKVKQVSVDGDIMATFDSMKQASIITGIMVSTISRHCLGKITNPTMGFKFEYV